MSSNRFTGDRITVRIPVKAVALVTMSFPLFSFLTCILWSLKYNFEASTATHCGVPNYLPSISATIGSFTPQRYIWRMGIAIHSAPRFLAAVCYYNCYISKLGTYDKGWTVLIRINCLLNVIENLALIGLTNVSSSENYAFHEKCFIAFMVCSEVYMLLSCYLSHKSRSRVPSSLELKSFKWKMILAITNIAVFLAAAYYFVRHNQYCEPGVYTKFALCEYIVVLTNIAFHGTAYWDFFHEDLFIGKISDKLS